MVNIILSYPEEDAAIQIEHYNNIHGLATELHKTTNMSTKIMREVFKVRDTPFYNLWHTSQFYTDPIDSVYTRTESQTYLVQKIWEQIPAEIKNKDLLMGLKEKSKNENPFTVHVEFGGHFYLI